MSPISSSILFPLLLVVFCDAYPVLDSKEMPSEKFARFIDRYEKLSSDNLDIDLEGGELQDVIKEVWNRGGTTSKLTPEELGYEYAVDKRAHLKGKYNYYKCYFNPVTCYRK